MKKLGQEEKFGERFRGLRVSFAGNGTVKS
jgi:hypothetical protein